MDLNGLEDGVSKCRGVHQSMDVTLRSPGHALQPGNLQPQRFTVPLDQDFPRPRECNHPSATVFPL